MYVFFSFDITILMNKDVYIKSKRAKRPLTLQCA